MVERRCDEAKF